MKREEYIRRYGEAEHQRQLAEGRERSRIRRLINPEKVKAGIRRWARANPDTVKANSHEIGRKGGKYYERRMKYRMTGVQHGKELIRGKHRRRWATYKEIIAPESQIHHEWIPETANYTGVALVEADQHMRGYIDVIQILEGDITLFTEKEISEALYPD